MGNLKDLIELLNEVRAINEAGPLSMDSKLTAVAEQHAAYMLQYNTLSHSGRNESNFEKRILNEGYSYKSAAENIAFGAASNEEVLDIWMNSPPHKENLINPQFTEIGIGVAPVLHQAPKNHQRYWSLSLAVPSEVETTLIAEPVSDDSMLN